MSIPSEPDESQPLLATPDVVEISNVQVGIMAVWRICQSLLFASIFPIITRMLVELDLATPKTVGLPAGLIESAFSVAVLAGLYPARILSDTYGRKSVILCGLVLGSAGTAVFGFCSTLWSLILSRMLAGLGISFIPAASSTMFLEASAHCKQTRAWYISVNASALALGNAIAPFIGGLLARPADHWSFFRTGLWTDYPYALSCLSVASVPILSAILGSRYTRDTRAKRSKPAYEQEAQDKPTVRQMLSGKCGVAVLIQFGIFISTYSYMCSETLIYYTPIELGGFGLSLREMTFALGIRPILISLSQLLLYPVLERRYGTVKILRVGCLLWCLVPLSYVALGSAISTYGLSKAWTYLGIACIYTILAMTNPIVPASLQLIVDSTPYKDHLSMLTTIIEYSNTLTAGLGAFLGSTIFRLSIEHQWLAGRAFYVFLASYVFVVAVSVRIATSAA